MNCNDFEAYIDEHLQPSDTQTARDFTQHLNACAACQARKQEHLHYLGVLSTFDTPTLASGRAARILRASVEQGKHQELQRTRSKGFISGFIAASVVAVVVLFGTSALNGSYTEQQPPEHATLVGEFDWSEEVTIVINAPEDMHGAELVLMLPSDISIQGLEHMSEVTWPINLKKGANTIVLPVNVEVFAEYADRLMLSASLIYKNSKKDFELDLRLEPSQKEKHGLHLPALLNKFA